MGVSYVTFFKLFHRFSFQKVSCSPFKKYFPTIFYFTLLLLFIIINIIIISFLPWITLKRKKENCYCLSLHSLLGWRFLFCPIYTIPLKPKINNHIISRLGWFFNDFKLKSIQFPLHWQTAQPLSKNLLIPVRWRPNNWKSKSTLEMEGRELVCSAQ